ncbi:hypothetical protein Psta_0266 [Pirellula staleyi DSM 6068]|uniref:DUF3828 domain-containing protein n=1 Tax=Pirellula staleyi (strain ATCC 27377 / DSM 6068 / ICPB 4128) TaxID=530564 RepID=D2R1H6_PIRSD|nr:hypothetical protein [Pirellula staleyi]ADB14961.1 hypothetical protein Psta_0266 [Pirellula staleyi DSM 6068]
MTSFSFVAAMLVAFAADPTNNAATHTPVGAVEAMNAILIKQDFAAFYDNHCHQHLRGQIDKKRFVDYMKSEAGAAIIKLFADVHAAITQKAGEDVLIARKSDKPDKYEFCLVQVESLPARKGQQWHLELQIEDDQWKLVDTD